jgi:hypothetical protein
MEGLKHEAQRRLLYQYRLSEVGRQNVKRLLVEASLVSIGDERHVGFIEPRNKIADSHEISSFEDD